MVLWGKEFAPKTYTSILHFLLFLVRVAFNHLQHNPNFDDLEKEVFENCERKEEKENKRFLLFLQYFLQFQNKISNFRLHDLLFRLQMI